LFPFLLRSCSFSGGQLQLKRQFSSFARYAFAVALPVCLQQDFVRCGRGGGDWLAELCLGG